MLALQWAQRQASSQEATAQHMAHRLSQVDLLYGLPDEQTVIGYMTARHVPDAEWHELELWLSDQCNQPIRLNQHNPARRHLPDLQASELQALEQQVRWLYAMDANAFGYPMTCSTL